MLQNVRKVLMAVFPTVVPPLKTPVQPLSKDWVAKVARTAQYTHDMPELIGMSEILMFLPGHRPTIGTLPYVVFTQSTYQVFDTEEVTVLLPHESNADKSPPWCKADKEAAAVVRGNMTHVTIPDLVELDRHYQNGVQFRRSLIRVTVPYKENRNGNAVFATSTQCYAYIGIVEHWKPLLDGGYRTKQRKAQPSGLLVIPNHVAEF